MSQVAPLPTNTTGSKPAPLLASVTGRVSARRRITTKDGAIFVTVLKLPAPDSYTSPQTIELRSKEPPPQVGEEWACTVRIGGYGRQYKATDPETGEQRTVATADNSLTVVE